jgi:putative two-component system response regulator
LGPRQKNGGPSLSIPREPFRSPGKVLVVDDVSANVELLKTLLTREGYEVVTASDGEQALEIVAREHPDLVLLDVLMPKLGGYEACERLKQNKSTRLTPVVLITALHERESKIQGINAGADDFLTKPVNIHELKARVRSLVRLKRYTDDLDSAESVIMSLALVIEARDAYTEGHCQRLALYATSLGASLGLGDDELGALHRGGYLHDLGKIGIPDAVLLKAERLTLAEYERIKDHPVIGDRLCGKLRSLRQVRPIVRHHHERLDGTGYPDGLKGDAIPLLAQIMSIVDVYDAITTARPYKRASLPEQAYEELMREVRHGWRRKDLVEAFITLGRNGRLDGADLHGSVSLNGSTIALG